MKRFLLPLVVGILVVSTGVALGSGVHGDYKGFPIVKVRVDGSEIQSDVPAINLDGRTMVPLRFVSEALGASVAWNSEEFSVRVSSFSSDQDVINLLKEIKKRYTARNTAAIPQTPDDIILMAEQQRKEIITELLVLSRVKPSATTFLAVTIGITQLNNEQWIKLNLGNMARAVKTGGDTQNLRNETETLTKVAAMYERMWFGAIEQLKGR